MSWGIGRLMAEITERYLKAPACNAFCIADENPALREIFTEDEMIQATSPEHFHSLVNDYLNGKINTDLWREKARKAVFDKHLYKHRALQIKQALEHK
jgi:spore maturation protein CgeB